MGIRMWSQVALGALIFAVSICEVAAISRPAASKGKSPSSQGDLSQGQSHGTRLKLPSPPSKRPNQQNGCVVPPPEECDAHKARVRFLWPVPADDLRRSVVDSDGKYFAKVKAAFKKQGPDAYECRFSHRETSFDGSLEALAYDYTARFKCDDQNRWYLSKFDSSFESLDCTRSSVQQLENPVFRYTRVQCHTKQVESGVWIQERGAFAGSDSYNSEVVFSGDEYKYVKVDEALRLQTDSKEEGFRSNVKIERNERRTLTRGGVTSGDFLRHRMEQREWLYDRGTGNIQQAKPNRWNESALSYTERYPQESRNKLSEVSYEEDVRDEFKGTKRSYKRSHAAGDSTTGEKLNVVDYSKNVDETNGPENEESLNIMKSHAGETISAEVDNEALSIPLLDRLKDKITTKAKHFAEVERQLGVPADFPNVDP